MYFMLKYLGSVGAYVRLNSKSNHTYSLLRVFSSSAASNVLFSASMNNHNGLISYTTASTSLYINGVSSSVVPSNEWTHVTFSFNKKLFTYDYNNFLIRWGDTSHANFNIQNVYIMDSSLTASAVGYLHKEFTGAGDYIIKVNDSASYSINFIDAPETNYSSSAINSIYQPLKNQLRFDKNVSALSEGSLSIFTSASTMVNDDLYVDGHNVLEGDYILSLQDNLIYQLSASSQLVPQSNLNGDFVRILFGREHANEYYLYASSSFTLTPARQKINSYLNIFDTNNA
jgi:hypothetical protein